MTPEQINIACAKLDGWKCYSDSMYPPGLPPEANVFGHTPPDYCHDGDAIRALVGKQTITIQRHVARAIAREYPRDGERIDVYDLVHVLLAPPEQVAVALLKAHNLYTE